MAGGDNRILTVNLPILTKKNWDRWSAQMRILFKFHDVSDVVESDCQEFASGTTDEQKVISKKKDNKALFIIHQCVDDVHFEKIRNVTTAKEAWNILVRSHAGSEKIKRVKLQILRRQYELLQMEDGDRIGEYFNKILTITNQMKGCGESITELMIIEKIMRSLPQKFDPKVVAIELSKDLSKMQIEELQSSLEAHEMRLVERNSIKNSGQALKVHHSKNDERKKQKKWKADRIEYDHDNKSESVERNGRSEKNQKRKDKRSVECFNCHRLGHYSYECYADKV
ncbi:uncharacterized protein LOC111241828 [Vigna radiata var. radiata]|uniref:Uncharacterized protein LOC111241828 n=1 Tax=Vigna radiata var. radiata TaxID=3916 RepID=A0A3Q0F4X8_VIGRR|nr:uncharacterized protein LOC111241828 [Vigna radiata var. radiata]